MYTILIWSSLSAAIDINQKNANKFTKSNQFIELTLNTVGRLPVSIFTFNVSFGDKLTLYKLYHFPTHRPEKCRHAVYLPGCCCSPMCCLLSSFIDKTVVNWKTKWTAKWPCVRPAKKATVHRPLISEVAAHYLQYRMRVDTLCSPILRQTASIRVVIQTSFTAKWAAFMWQQQCRLKCVMRA